MPNSYRGKKYLVVTQDYMSGYVEAQALTKNSLAQVSKFLEEVIFAR
jgi:hypothetical protein